MKRTASGLWATTVALLLGASAAEAGRCYTYITFFNDDRRVPGPVNVECGGFSDGFHSAPFGNWGVNSPYGRIRDGYQFSGWHSDDGWLQWNSCTSEPKYRTSTYLPEEPQLARAHWNLYEGYGTLNLYGGTTQRGPSNETCDSVHSAGLLVFGGQYMAIYELDLSWDFFWGGNGSDHVITLRYPILSATVALWCETPYKCSGVSPWLSPRNPGVVSANIQIRVEARYY